MRANLHSHAIVVAAFLGGLALFVAGFVMALDVRSTEAASSAAVTGGACYTNWNADTCAAGYTAVETGVWTVILSAAGYVGPFCAAEKAQGAGGLEMRVGTRHMETDHDANQEPCAICCASGGAAVGGIAELPEVPLAIGGGSGSSGLVMGALLIAVAVITFGGAAWYVARQWAR